ncbi:MAG: Ig-like domain-containing protein [Gemmatimonadaceae bacterium]
MQIPRGVYPERLQIPRFARDDRRGARNDGIRSTHVARIVCAACVFLVSGCSNDTGRAIAGQPSIEFRDGLIGFDAVDVFPVPSTVLSRLRETNPSDAEWQDILGVHAGDISGLPMAGIYTVAGDTLRFQPGFPPLPGPSYIARFDSRALYDKIQQRGPGQVVTKSWSFTIAKGPSSTAVREVYPTADAVPMNLLKMYVEFSAPMSTGRSYDYIKLYDQDSLLAEPFFTAGGAVELWDPDKTRLTILFDPGRIKRDLKPNEQLGLPLRAGRSYRLVIDSAWPDAQGRPLTRGHVKGFRVVGMDRSLVRTAQWRLRPPRTATRDSLLLDFPEPLDRALLGRLLTVRTSGGTLVPGTIAISGRETRWAFVPHGTWSAETYYVDVDSELEDLAGNNLRKLFDVAPGDTAATTALGARARLNFTPR